MKPEYERLKKDIIFEEGQLDIVIEQIEKMAKEEINETGKAALAAYLMNFYNGVENIMKRCAKDYYKKAPKGIDWHKKLLQQSRAGNGSKQPLFSEEIVDRLYGYLTFRHFFVHGYGFKLKLEKMKPLLDDISELWKRIKAQLTEFISRIEIDKDREGKRRINR